MGKKLENTQEIGIVYNSVFTTIGGTPAEKEMDNTPEGRNGENIKIKPLKDSWTEFQKNFSKLFPYLYGTQTNTFTWESNPRPSDPKSDALIHCAMRSICYWSAYTASVEITVYGNGCYGEVATFFLSFLNHIHSTKDEDNGNQCGKTSDEKVIHDYSSDQQHSSSKNAFTGLASTEASGSLFSFGVVCISLRLWPFKPK
ncbi:hypothetical protein YC2023_093608 [Brassica napus]